MTQDQGTGAIVTNPEGITLVEVASQSHEFVEHPAIHDKTTTTLVHVPGSSSASSGQETFVQEVTAQLIENERRPGTMDTMGIAE